MIPGLESGTDDCLRRCRDWTITGHNRSEVIAFRDPLHITTYLDGRGTAVEERHERPEDIFEPDVTRMIELNDEFAGPAFTTTRLIIVAAEALLHTRR